MVFNQYIMKQNIKQQQEVMKLKYNQKKKTLWIKMILERLQKFIDKQEDKYNQ